MIIPQVANIGTPMLLVTMAVTRWVILLAAFVGAWHLVVSLISVPEFVLPSPIAVGREAFINRLTLAEALLVTTWKASAGLAISLGLALGVVLRSGNFPVLTRGLMTITAALEAVPKIVFAPILTVWLGIATSPKIVLAIMLCLYPILQRVFTAWEACPSHLISFATSLGVSPQRLTWRIRLRWMLPDVLEAIKLATPLAFVGVIVGELIASQNGVGPIMLRAMGELNMPLVVASAILTAAVAGFFVGVVEIWRRRVGGFKQNA